MNQGTKKRVTIIGGGLAGSEAALVLSSLGILVDLIESKPTKLSPAHSTSDFAEIVCSNSLKSMELSTASGLLKQELLMIKSPLISVAKETSVPAGSALAVDRKLFSKSITQKINENTKINVINKEATDLDFDLPIIVASGPLTHQPLLENLSEYIGTPLHFYDAAAPIVEGESVDYSKTFSSSRYGKGSSDYINCPLSKEEYNLFYSSLISAEQATKKEFEKGDVFESCMPVEEMAKRGVDALRFGPMRPVGLLDEQGKRPYAVVQLRKENAAGEMYNLVGFQTNLKFSEQKRVFSLIPALSCAEFVRYGVMHRNSFVNAPKCLNADFSLIKNPNIYIAGQLSGVEGYVESIMSGHIAALSAAFSLFGKDFVLPPLSTMMGALCNYLTKTNENFQPMNANFSLLPTIANIRDKRERKLALSQKSCLLMNDYIEEINQLLN